MVPYGGAVVVVWVGVGGCVAYRMVPYSGAVVILQIGVGGCATYQMLPKVVQW